MWHPTNRNMEHLWRYCLPLPPAVHCCCLPSAVTSAAQAPLGLHARMRTPVPTPAVDSAALACREALYLLQHGAEHNGTADSATIVPLLQRTAALAPSHSPAAAARLALCAARLYPSAPPLAIALAASVDTSTARAATVATTIEALAAAAVAAAACSGRLAPGRVARYTFIGPVRAGLAALTSTNAGAEAAEHLTAAARAALTVLPMHAARLPAPRFAAAVAATAALPLPVHERQECLQHRAIRTRLAEVWQQVPPADIVSLLSALYAAQLRPSSPIVTDAVPKSLTALLGPSRKVCRDLGLPWTPTRKQDMANAIEVLGLLAVDATSEEVSERIAALAGRVLGGNDRPDHVSSSQAGPALLVPILVGIAGVRASRRSRLVSTRATVATARLIPCLGQCTPTQLVSVTGAVGALQLMGTVRSSYLVALEDALTLQALSGLRAQDLVTLLKGLGLICSAPEPSPLQVRKRQVH
jgi:hypothetical protein